MAAIMEERPAARAGMAFNPLNDGFGAPMLRSVLFSWQGDGGWPGPAASHLNALAGPELEHRMGSFDWQGDGSWQYRLHRPFALTRSLAFAGSAARKGARAAAMGWIPDLPDRRDLVEGPRLEQMTKAVRRTKNPLLFSRKPGAQLRAMVNNQRWCSPVENQGALGSCTANAAVGLVEYEMRRNNVEHTDGSRLFVYKTTRNLLGWSGDTGAYLRTTLKAIAAFGVPPEEQWPYELERYEEEPTPYLYAYAQNCRALKYVRLDPHESQPAAVLGTLKRVLADGYGIIFGFTVYESLGNSPDIPFPDGPNARVVGGHAVMAVGYNDDHVTVEGRTVPSLIIRNSWGEQWGLGGYGFLPYEYVTAGLADDFWTVFNISWLEEQQFN
jgi:C1A family cysteine protease